MSENLLAAQYVAGTGRRNTTDTGPLVALSVQDARHLMNTMEYPIPMSRLLQGFTCYCEAKDLDLVAAAMTSAAQTSGTQRVFFTVTYQGLVGPFQRWLVWQGGLLSIYFLLPYLLLCLTLAWFS
ncbi:MAG: hypothetical protein KM310_02865 [Clostridiales bacterium]|nr:hypothetical protein [Clostridiales bacterium]